MGLDITGVGSALTAIQGLAKQFLGDKSQEAQNAFTLQLTAITQEAAAAQAQAAIDAAEASSPDRINHWRGGLGWTLTAAFAWQYVLEPMAKFGCAVAKIQAVFPVLDVSAMYPLMFAMLGVTTAHVYQQVKS